MSIGNKRIILKLCLTYFINFVIIQLVECIMNCAISKILFLLYSKDIQTTLYKFNEGYCEFWYLVPLTQIFSTGELSASGEKFFMVKHIRANQKNYGYMRPKECRFYLWTKIKMEFMNLLEYQRLGKKRERII